MANENLNNIKSYLSFNIGNEEFAANVDKVLNILDLIKITKVPKAPDYMKGVINMRGSVLPVVDTRIKLGLSSAEYTPKTSIIVMEAEIGNETLQIGALVDSVCAVLEIQDSEIQPPPALGSTYQSEYIYGMVKVDDRFIMLLDMEKLFFTKEVSS